MARPRVPSCYGLFQWIVRLLALVAETCALGALISLTKDGFTLPIAFLAAIFGIFLEMIELVALTNTSYNIKRTPSVWLIAGDSFLLCLGLASLIWGVFKYLDWDPGMLDGHGPASVWAPWYLGFQLAAGTLHFMCMLMHCVDYCRYSPHRYHDDD